MAVAIIDLGLGHVRIQNSEPQSLSSIAGDTYGPAEGYPVLREAIASWEKVPVDEIALTTGASVGLVATLATLKRPSSILCPRPYYPAYPKVAAMLGLEVIYYNLYREHGWQPDPQQIAQLLRNDTRALLWNFPNNPTGSIPTDRLLKEMRQIVHRAGILVISDEVYAHFSYKETPFSGIYEIVKRTSVVRLRSFSKIFGIPGERLGYVIADHERLKAIGQAHWALAMSPPATAQNLALAILHSEPDCRIQKLRQALMANRDSVVKILNKSRSVECITPPAGIFFWIGVNRTDRQIDSRALAQACALKARVMVMPGAAFGIEHPAYLRASFAVPKDEAVKGFEALVDFLEQFLS